MLELIRGHSLNVQNLLYLLYLIVSGIFQDLYSKRQARRNQR